MSAQFLIVLFMVFGGIPALSTIVRDRAVFYRQRDAHVLTASAFVWGNALVQVPLSCIEVLVFTLISYFMVGFSTGARERSDKSCVLQHRCARVQGWSRTLLHACRRCIHTRML